MRLIGNGPFGLFTLSHASFTIEHMFETLAEDAPSQTEKFSAAFARLNRLRGRCRRAFVEAAVEDSAVGAGSGSAVASGSGSVDLVPLGFGPSLATLQLAVEGFARCGVPADGGALVALRSELDRLCALVAEAEVRFDVGEVWRNDGAGSLRGWFADRGGLGRKAATAEARRVERLEAWPEVGAAWSNGELSGAKVDVLVAAVPRRFVSLFADHAPGVVRAIAPLDVEQTTVAVRQWVRAAEAADGAEDLRERPSGVYLDQGFDGSFVLQGQLNATEAAIVDAAFRVFDVPDDFDENGEVIGERRTTGKRQADALVAACSFALAHRDGAGESGRFQPHVSLVFNVQELRAAALQGAGVSSLADVDDLAARNGWSAAEKAWFVEAMSHHGDGVTSEGMLVDATAMSTLSCDSVVQAVLTNGSQVLRLGRTERTAKSWQRRAIIARDRHCRAPGCRTKPKYCDVHHVDHWVNGGKTDVDRMVLLCGTHHREFHKPGYQMEFAEDGEFTVHSPKGWTRSSMPEHAEATVFRSLGSREASYG
jgi:hypothetical protein